MAATYEINMDQKFFDFDVNKKVLYSSSNSKEDIKKGINLKKEIVNYNMKLEENKKKFSKKEKNQINFQTNFVDVPYCSEGNSQNIRGPSVKNKMLIISQDSNTNGRGQVDLRYKKEFFPEKSTKSLKQNAGGTLYKTHTFREKFSNPHFVFEQLSISSKISDEKFNRNESDFLKSLKVPDVEEMGSSRERNETIKKNDNDNFTQENEKNQNPIAGAEASLKTPDNLDHSLPSEHSPEKISQMNTNTPSEKAKENLPDSSPHIIANNHYNYNSHSNIPNKLKPSINTNLNDIKNLNINMNNYSNNGVKTASTIYTMLTKRKNELFSNISSSHPTRFNDDNLVHNINLSKSTMPSHNTSTLNQKKNFMKMNQMTYYLDKKVSEDIPHVYPIVWIHQNDYENISEKNRYEKITQMFIKLRYHIDKDEENEKSYLKEFIMKHGIHEDRFYAIDKLNNFMNFLKSDSISKLNPNKTIKEIIIEATNFGEENENEEFFDKKNQKNSKKISNRNLTVDSHRKSKANSKRYFDTDKDRFNMSSYLSHPQPILDDKKFKIKSEAVLIYKLENEMERLRNGEGGLNFIISEKSNMKYLSRNNSEMSAKKNSPENLRKLERKATNLSRKNEYEENDGLPVSLPQHLSNQRYKLPLIKTEIDIDLVKKKNKLLEYIVLNRTKSRHIWKTSTSANLSDFNENL